MNIMKKRNIFLGLVLMLGLTGCYDLDKMPEGVLSTTIPFASTGEMRNYLDQFYQTGNYKYDYVSFGDGMRAQGFDAGGGQYIAGADTHSDNMASSSVSTRLAGETTLSSAVKLQNYTAIRNLNFMLCNLDNCVEKGSADYNQYVGEAYYFRAWYYYQMFISYGRLTWVNTPLDPNMEEMKLPRANRTIITDSILADLDKAVMYLNTQNNSATMRIHKDVARALKSEVALFEGTWEKYNGRGNADETNGDGIQSGAGTVIPDNYPSIESLLTMAKECSGKFVEGGEYGNEYAVWMPDEELSGYENQAAYYYFILEDAASNPYGLDKSSNDEAIFRLIFDYDKNKKSGQNLSHTAPVSGTRKLMDMFLCKDGLPVHKSKLFNGYKGLNTEFENRDSRMTALFKRVDYCYWGYAGSGKGNPSDYTTTPDLGNGGIGYIPKLSAYSANDIAYEGRKFVFERNRKTEEEAFDYNHIRLPEMLLTYAEAVYELNGNIDNSILDKTINVIRKRAHIADLTNELVNNYGLDMLEEIRRERAIELIGEGFRFSDLCRWGIAEQEINRPRCSYYISVNGQPNELGQSTYYDPSQFTTYITDEEEAQSVYTEGLPTLKAGALIMEKVNNRVFSRKNYLQAIPLDEIALNSNLKQNPNW